MPTRSDEQPITAQVHGLRNVCAPFDGGTVELVVGGMLGPSYAGSEESVLLTIEGRDAKGQIIDIEVAVQLGQVRALLERIAARAHLQDDIASGGGN